MKTPKHVDKEFLAAAIRHCEDNGPLPNLSRLHNDVADEYNIRSVGLPPITASIVQLRIKEWEIPVKTQKGKQGRQKGVKVTVNRVARADKFAADPKAVAAIKAMRKSTPKRFQYVVDAIEQGSAKAGIKLKCLECNGFCEGDSVSVTDEIRHCQINDCGNFLFRPYQ